MAGWVKVYRDLLDKPIFQNDKLLKVFIWCLLKASHKKNTQLIGRKTVVIQPGQFATGRVKAGLELGLPPSTAWSYLKLLESNSTVDIKSNSKYSVITLVNWALYQGESQKSDSKCDSIVDNKRTANGQQMDTNKNDKNDKNGKKRDIAGAESVLITEAEHAKLLSQMGSEWVVDEYANRLHAYMGSKGKKYKSHYLTMLNWWRRDRDAGKLPKPPASTDYDEIW